MRREYYVYDTTTVARQHIFPLPRSLSLSNSFMQETSTMEQHAVHVVIQNTVSSSVRTAKAEARDEVNERERRTRGASNEY
jgi:hypothetical protein